MSYPTECKHCKKYVWPDAFCCKEAFRERDDGSVLINRQEIHYKHDDTYYVPVYQINFDLEGNPITPTFQYSMSEATHDEQMAWSMEPDYVLILKGTFDAKTKPYIVKGE